MSSVPARAVAQRVDEVQRLRPPTWAWIAGLTLLALTPALAGGASGAPSGLPATWIAAGIGAVLLAHAPHGRRLAAATAIGIAVATGAAAHVDPGLAAVQALVATLHAAAIVAGARAPWLENHCTWPQQGASRLARLAFLVLAVIIPSSLCAASLQVLPLPGHVRWTPWNLTLLHAAASGLVVVLLAPMLMPDGQARRAPAAQVIGALAAAGATWLALQTDPRYLWVLGALVVVGAFAFGPRMASAMVAATGATIFVFVEFRDASPFSGPDGFFVTVMFLWRLALAGQVAAVWIDRRHRHGPTAAQAARVFPSVEAWRRHARAGRKPAGPHTVLLAGWRSAPCDSRGTSRATLAVAEQAGRSLRAGDAVVVTGPSGLAVILCCAPVAVVPAIADRVRQLLVGAAGTSAWVDPVDLGGESVDQVLERCQIETGSARGADAGPGEPPVPPAPPATA